MLLHQHPLWSSNTYVNKFPYFTFIFGRLENIREAEWGNLVEVISCDMREWEAPEKTDILVSELLGSFGDNELSPECLDGAQRYLKGKIGVMSND